MSDKQKGVLAVLAALAIVVVLWLLGRKSGSPDTNGNYLTYNNGGGTQFSGSAGGLPSIPASVADNSCGCNSTGAGGNFFGSLQDMLAAYSASLGGWIKQVQASAPSLANQYQNNPATVSLSISSIQAFQGISTADGASYNLG